MKVLSETDYVEASPLVCGIGVYDGMHLGHQAIVRHLYKRSHSKGKKCLITFSPHPNEVIQKESIPLLLSLQHRLHLFEQYGIDFALVLAYTAQLAKEPYSYFLLALREKIPFSHLVFGSDGHFGYHDPTGNKKTELLSLAKQHGFEVEFVKKETHHKETISGKAIRDAITRKDFKKVKKMMGRPYSILVPYHSSQLKRENETLYSYSVTCQDLFPVPSGIYAVDLKTLHLKIPSIALVSSSPFLSITLFFDVLLPPHSEHLDIVFIEYLHQSIDQKELHKTFLFAQKKCTTQPI